MGFKEDKDSSKDQKKKGLDKVTLLLQNSYAYPYLRQMNLTLNAENRISSNVSAISSSPLPERELIDVSDPASSVALKLYQEDLAVILPFASSMVRLVHSLYGPYCLAPSTKPNIKHRGLFKYSNDGYYIGEWKKGTMTNHGFGILVASDGQIYEGEWADDKRNGKGREIWASGNIYIGHYKDDKMNGHGVHLWTNGDSYEGDWLNDHFHGQGVHKFADGTSYDGEWANGDRHGKGVEIETNGDRYEGGWYHDLKHGPGVFIAASGETRKELWFNQVRLY